MILYHKSQHKNMSPFSSLPLLHTMCNVTRIVNEYSNYMCQCVSRERQKLDNSQLKMNEY